jgi:hypothetical protein
MSLIPAMKRPPLHRIQAPTPRLTLWVPVLAALVLSLLWTGLLVVFHR